MAALLLSVILNIFQYQYGKELTDSHEISQIKLDKQQDVIEKLLKVSNQDQKKSDFKIVP